MSHSWARLWSTIPMWTLVKLEEKGSGSDNVQCRTDLLTCYSVNQGVNRGDWYFPSGGILPFPGSFSDIVESRQAQRIDLRHKRGTGPISIYCCDIETEAVHGSGKRETVYVGLYVSDGGK